MCTFSNVIRASRSIEIDGLKYFTGLKKSLTRPVATTTIRRQPQQTGRRLGGEKMSNKQIRDAVTIEDRTARPNRQRLGCRVCELSRVGTFIQSWLAQCERLDEGVHKHATVCGRHKRERAVARKRERGRGAELERLEDWLRWKTSRYKKAARHIFLPFFFFCLSFLLSFFPLHNATRLYAPPPFGLTVYLLPPTSFQCIYYFEKEARGIEKEEEGKKKRRKRDWCKYARGWK